jgi:hypothetical protein
MYNLFLTSWDYFPHPFTKSMELGPFHEVVSCTATKGFPNTLRKPEARYRVHKSPPLNPNHKPEHMVPRTGTDIFILSFPNILAFLYIEATFLSRFILNN